MHADLASFDSTIVPAIERILARRDLAPWRDAVVERVRVTVADYQGTEPLRAWAGHLALETAVDLAHQHGWQLVTGTKPHHSRGR